MNLFDISGRTAIVTGGARGLGKGMTEGLLESGVRVVIWGRSQSTETIAQKWREKGYDCKAVIANLTDREDRKRGFEEAVEILGGKLDIMVNCAGVQRRNLAENFLIEDWDEVIEINLTAVFDLCQLAGNRMLLQGGGKIINIASMLSFFGGQTVVAYAASKGGVAQITKALASEWADRNININAIAPGYMATEMNAALLEPSSERGQKITERIPAKRWGTDKDMKGVCIFLASPASDYLNGAIIPVDGGYLIK